MIVKTIRVLDPPSLLGPSFAMAAFGTETTFTQIRQASRKPLLPGTILFAYLIIFGNWINFALPG